MIQSNVAHTLHALDQLGANVSPKEKLIMEAIFEDMKPEMLPEVANCFEL
jgi:hypothetical protein